MSTLSSKTLTILDTALMMVRNIGFESVSISALASEVGMSKSGLFAHFNSKEKMHLMILDHAAEKFSEDVFRKSLSAERGLPRLRTIIKNWFAWYKSGEGGTCPFIAASVEYDKKLGPVKEKLKFHVENLVSSLAISIDHCIEEKHFSKKTNSKQVAYEIYSFICGALIYHRTLESKHTLALFKKSFEDLVHRYSK